MRSIELIGQFRGINARITLMFDDITDQQLREQTDNALPDSDFRREEVRILDFLNNGKLVAIE